MAIAFGSSSTSQTATVTAPSSISAGDILVFIVAGQGTPTAPSGFTETNTFSVDGSGVLNNVRVSLSYRIATVSDESETSYAASGSEIIGAVMYRLTGGNTSSPFFSVQSTSDTGTSSSATASITGLSVLRPSDQMHFVFGFGTSGDNTDDFATSNYIVTSGDANPTWTEVLDDDTNSNTGNDAVWAMSAYAASTDTSNVTAVSADYVLSGSWAYILGYFMIVTPTNASADVSRINLVPGLLGLEGSNDASADIDRVDMNVTPRDLTPKRQRTTWTPASRSDGSWTARPK